MQAPALCTTSPKPLTLSSKIYGSRNLTQLLHILLSHKGIAGIVHIHGDRHHE